MQKQIPERVRYNQKGEEVAENKDCSSHSQKVGEGKSLLLNQMLHRCLSFDQNSAGAVEEEDIR